MVERAIHDLWREVVKQRTVLDVDNSLAAIDLNSEQCAAILEQLKSIKPDQELPDEIVGAINDLIVEFTYKMAILKHFRALQFYFKFLITHDSDCLDILLMHIFEAMEDYQQFIAGYSDAVANPKKLKVGMVQSLHGLAKLSIVTVILEKRKTYSVVTPQDIINDTSVIIQILLSINVDLGHKLAPFILSHILEVTKILIKLPAEPIKQLATEEKEYKAIADSSEIADLLKQLIQVASRFVNIFPAKIALAKIYYEHAKILQELPATGILFVQKNLVVMAYYRMAFDALKSLTTLDNESKALL